MANAASSAKDFREKYGISSATFYRQVKAGKLIARKIGRKTIVLDCDAKNWESGLDVLNTSGAK